MASYYLDSSALVKYYHPEEAGSDAVIRLVGEPDSRHFISRLTTVEVVSAFALKARTRENRDREAPHGFPPPTPPGIRVRTMAVRCG